MSKLVPPHGSDALIPLLAPEAEIAEELKRASTLRKVPMSSRETSDFIMLAMGAYTPLAGFMSKADWRGVCADMKLPGGLFWPIPITLSATRGTRGQHRHWRDGRAGGPGLGRDHGHAGGLRKIRACEGRQGIRVPAHLPHHRPEASGRGEGDGAGRVQPRGPCDGAERRRLPEAVQGPLLPSRRDARAVRRQGLEQGGRFPDAQPDAPQP